MVHAPLDMKYIYKRKRLCERRKHLTEGTQYPDLSKKSSRSFYKAQVDSFLNSCSSYRDAINLLEALYTDNDFELLETATKKTINEIIPMLPSSDFDGCINMIKSANIGNVNKDKLTETVRLYKRVDRISNNHQNLAKRFDLSSLNYCSDKDRCFKLCEMVDTYNTSKFNKFNIVLEEMMFLGSTTGKSVLEEELVENTLNYFLLIENNSNEDIESYRNAIESSKVLSEHATANIAYFYKKPAYSQYWKDQLNNWKLSPNKNINTLIDLVQENCSDFLAVDSIISVIKEFCHINTKVFNPIRIFENIDPSIGTKEIKNIINIMESNDVDDSHPAIYKLKTLWENKINDESYDSAPKNSESFTSDEIDTFKMKNLMSDAKETEKFLNQLEKTSMKESSCDIKPLVTYPIDINESNKINYVDESEYISIPVKSYSYHGKKEDILDLLNSSTKCLNNILHKTDSSAYYNLYESQFDICIKSKYKVILSEAQELARELPPSDKYTFLRIYHEASALEEIYNSQLPTIIEKLITDKTLAATISVQEAVLIYDIISPVVGTIHDKKSNCILNDFMESCKNEANPQYDKIRKACLNLQTEAFSFDHNIERIDTCVNLLNLLEEENAKIDKKKKDKEDAKMDKDSKQAEVEKRSTALSVNKLKLAWEGLKTKFSKASTKEQEFSRNIDLEFNHLLKLFNNATSSNASKEAITGEVNHSISKIIKVAVGLAGVGALTGGGVLIPIFGLIGLYAKSKFLSRAEKVKIIDTIDIELKVLERELSAAEQEGTSSAKYRQLLTIQKNLQRKRQEIYLGLAIKGPIPVDSTVGLSKE